MDPRQPSPSQGSLPADEAGEQALIVRAKAGDRRAWDDLVRIYQDRLFGVCVRMVRDRELAADLTQDAFVKVIQGLDRYDGRSKFSTWAIRVTMNVCLSKLRAEKLRRHASLDVPAGGSGGSGEGVSWGESRSQSRELGPVRGVETDEDRHVVLRALHLLDADQRAVLVLRDGRGLDYEQIAEALGVAVGTVKSRLFRARVALRRAIESLGGGFEGSGRGAGADGQGEPGNEPGSLDS